MNSQVPPTPQRKTPPPLKGHQSSKATLLLPTMLIATGCGWLLSVLDLIPPLQWIWAIGLVVIGVAVFVISGWDKVTFVSGGFFLTSGLMSFLRQMELVSLEIELPVLVIVTGFYMLIAHHAGIPRPKWIDPNGT